MSGPERAAGHPAAVLGAGLVFLLFGGALLLQELGMLTLRWTVLLPVIMIAAGAAVAVAGVAAAARSRGGRS